MAYNLFGEAKKAIDWNALHTRLQPHTKVEVVPMPKDSLNKHDAIGLSVPMSNIGLPAWRDMQAVVAILRDEFDFELYDMYYGKRVDAAHMSTIKQEIV